MDRETLNAHIKKFLDSGGEIEQIPAGVSAFDLNISVPLGIKSHGNITRRESLAPKKGYNIPDDI